MGTHQRRYALWAHLAGARRGFTLRELARRFGVAKNTIQRDLDQLSQGGALIREEQEGQTMLFQAGNGPPATELTEDEKLAISAAEASFVRWVGAPLAADLTSAVAKLRAGSAMQLELKGPVARVRPDVAVLKTVLAGLREHRRCALTYLRRGGEKARVLKAEPIRIVAATGLLYLRAVVRPRGAMVTLALHLVKAAELLGEHFIPISDDPGAFGATGEKPEHVVVRFHPDIAAFIEERIWHPSQRLYQDRDGWLRFEATLGGMHEFVGWVMSWGPRAELIEPRGWRREMLSRAESIASLHKGVAHA